MEILTQESRLGELCTKNIAVLIGLIVGLETVVPRSAGARDVQRNGCALKSDKQNRL